MHDFLLTIHGNGSLRTRSSSILGCESVKLRILSLIIAACLTACTPIVRAAEAYIPASDDTVLETLPRALLAGWDELTTLRRQLAAQPNNVALASKVASRYLQMGNQEGDPRFYGYARAAISPWWLATRSPPAILLLRAKLKEKDHRYDEALADLDALLQQEPQNTQAWIETANIYRVQGKYLEARHACDILSAFAGAERTKLCVLPIQAVTGEAEDAYNSLEQTLPVAKQRWPAAVSWILTMQAKIAWALGKDEQAEAHFRAGLAKNPRDTYMMRDYADFLLDRQRNDEVLALLRDHTNDNGILLRAAIAARRNDESSLAKTWQTQLESRFEEIRLRGNQPHGRFEARYALELKKDPQLALSLALENWSKQKEARDTRNVLEAAIATKNREAAQKVLLFLAANRTEDIVLQQLVTRLEEN